MSRKEAILQAAATFFAERGFAESAISDIAKAAGVADGTVFYHYKTKEDLYRAVLEDFQDRIAEALDGYLADRRFTSGLDMVEGIVAFYLYLAGTMEERFLLLHRHDPYRLAQSNPAFRQHLENIYTRLFDVFERAIARGQRDGSIADVPARETALLLLTLVDGVVRLNAYNLYHADSLNEELIASCRRMLKKT